MEGGTALLHALAFTLMLVCQVQVVGLTPFQLVIIGTAMEVTLLLCEIPTGAVADLYSRRRSVLIGTAIIAVSFLLQGGWPSLWPTLAGQVIWGLGYTFVRGRRRPGSPTRSARTTCNRCSPAPPRWCWRARWPARCWPA